MQWREKIMTPDQAERKVDLFRRQSKLIAFTNGCFDVFHAGHVRLLMYARALADVLVLALNSDSSISLLKGPGRPVNGQRDRAEVVAALACVNLVIIFDDRTPVNLLHRLRPDIYVKGGDYPGRSIPEAELVRAYGAKVYYAPLLEGRSTTGIIEKIKNLKHG
ncbi:MAG: D-glycero-beta-D-manno-heptose 1-phosphate adenylyltransferase [Bacillota bacterium]|jgi:rfaE bifunctional protein nucleotidyltransferase chain/domain